MTIANGKSLFSWREIAPSMGTLPFSRGKLSISLQEYVISLLGNHHAHRFRLTRSRISAWLNPTLNTTYALNSSTFVCEIPLPTEYNSQFHWMKSDLFGLKRFQHNSSQIIHHNPKTISKNHRISRLLPTTPKVPTKPLWSRESRLAPPGKRIGW